MQELKKHERKIKEINMELDAETIYGFVGSMLLSRFDNPKKTPAFHMDLWRACCSKNRTVAMAAPRG